MIKKILPLVNRLLPQHISMKGLSKIDPRIGQFFANSAAFGYAANEALDFFRDQVEGNNDGNLRPDELAANESIRQSKIPGKIASTALKAGAGASAIAALPSVIGNLFQNEEEEKPQGLPDTEIAKMKALGKLMEKTKKKSEYSQESMEKQFYDKYGNQNIPEDEDTRILLQALDKASQTFGI